MIARALRFLLWWAALSLAAAAFGAGCDSNHLRCSGAGSCERFASEQCSKVDGCSWGERCLDVDCYSIEDESACASVPRCKWDLNGPCYPATGSVCVELDQAACSARTDCVWGASCAGTFLCDSVESQRECAALGPDCSWSHPSSPK